MDPLTSTQHSEKTESGQPLEQLLEGQGKLKKLNRKDLFADLRILSDAMVTPGGLTFPLFGITVTSVFCNGKILMMLWDYDGKKDTTFPVHIHKGIIEHIGIIQGTLRCVVGGEEKVYNTPGSHVLIPSAVPHQVMYRKEDGPASGWSLLIPPDDTLIPRSTDESQICLLAKAGRCGITPEECLKNKLCVME